WRDIARVQRGPFPGGGGGTEVDGHRVAGVRVEYRSARAANLGDIEGHRGRGGYAEGGVGDAVGGDEYAIAVDRRGDQRRVGQHGAVAQGDGGQGSAWSGGDRGDLHLVRYVLSDDHVMQGLAVRWGDGDGLV